MPHQDSLLDRIHRTPDAAALLAWPFDFDITRTDPVEPVHLESGTPLEPIAGDGSGGTFFLCGQAADNRPVLFADSEGQAGVIGHDLTSTLELIVCVPYWRDCLAFSPHGAVAMASATAALETEFDHADINASRARLAELLSLRIPSTEEALSRLLEALALPDFTLLNESDLAYEPLGG
uniref:hypothetical protein n=1 Tax=Herbidospora sakaeratensis TaxID=564415 RepID=UPI000781C7D1|nr:hypothetical protein [Herbidospora sakaeratensis]